MENENSWMDKIKKALGITLMAGTISGMSGQALANQPNFINSDNQKSSEMETDEEFVSKYYEIESGRNIIGDLFFEYNQTEIWAKQCENPEIWSEELDKKFLETLMERKGLTDSTNEYEQQQLEDVTVNLEIKEKIEQIVKNNKTGYQEQIKTELQAKIQSLINRNLISLESSNDTLRVDGLQRELEEWNIEDNSIEEIVIKASQFENKIQKSREILKAKMQLLGKNEVYINLQQELEKINEQIDKEKGVGTGRITKAKPEYAALVQQLSLVKAKIMLEEAKVESKVSHMVFSKEKSSERNEFVQSLKQDADENQVMNKTSIETRETEEMER